jgi:REP element-mobilizing transposase RayT
MDRRGGHERKNLRFRGYDYASDGAYFITVLTLNRECIFGNIVGDEIKLSKYGEIAREEWFASESIRKEIRLFEDELVIMPNHVHGIVWILPSEDMGATCQSPLQLGAIEQSGPRPKSLGAFVTGFKGAVTRRMNEIGNIPGDRVWMRNYHDRVIRNERELKTIRKYIRENLLNWELDRHYSLSDT